MRVLTSVTAHTVAEVVAALSNLPPTLPVAVYAEEGGWTAHVERGVRIERITNDDGSGECVSIENND